MLDRKTMSIDLSRYKTWLFDCDGVIFDSNEIKSNGFYEIAIRYGKDAAEKMVNYHKKYGGISRYEKINILICDILKKNFTQKEFDRLVYEYGNYCYQKLMTCSVTPGFHTLIETLPQTTGRFVVSGGRQDELATVFLNRNLAQYFDEIYGSPLSKKDILAKLHDEGKLVEPVVFVGDSRYDYEVASIVDADFIFMSQFTEFVSWESYFADKPHIHINNMTDLISLL